MCAVGERVKRANCNNHNDVLDYILKKSANVLRRERKIEVVDSFRSVTNERGNIRFVREIQVLCGAGSQRTRADSIGEDEKYEKEVLSRLESQ